MLLVFPVQYFSWFLFNGCIDGFSMISPIAYIPAFSPEAQMTTLSPFLMLFACWLTSHCSFSLFSFIHSCHWYMAGLNWKIQYLKGRSIVPQSGQNLLEAYWLIKTVFPHFRHTKSASKLFSMRLSNMEFVSCYL